MFRFWKRAAKSAVDAGEMQWALAHPASSAEQRLAAQQQLAQVWDTVERLSNNQRTVFLLRFVDEMDLLEIAAATGMPLPTVKTHLSPGTGHCKGSSDAGRREEREMRQSHLNSSQMERMLTETAKEDLLRHVEECAECHAEVAALRRVFGDLKASAMALATVERRLAQPPVQVWWRVRRPVWAVVAVVLAALVVPAAMHRGGQKPKAPAIPAIPVCGDALR